MSLESVAWGDRRQSHYVVRIEQRQNEPTLFLGLPFHDDTSHTHTHTERERERELGGCREDGNKGETELMD